MASRQDRTPRRPHLTVIPGGLDAASTDDDDETLLADLLDAECHHRVHQDGSVTITYDDATPWLRALRHLARKRAKRRHPSSRG